MRSFLDVMCEMLPVNDAASCFIVRVDGLGCGWSGRVHRPVEGSRVPFQIHVLFELTSHFVDVYVT